MGSKKHRNRISPPRSREVSYAVIIAAIAIVFSVALVIRVVFFPSQSSLKNRENSQSLSLADLSIENQVRLISENFRCACEGCDELQLVECECNMPRGAQEEKGFMRQKLKAGLSVDQIIQLVDEKYGYRNI